jgi:hypothetical protein
MKHKFFLFFALAALILWVTGFGTVTAQTTRTVTDNGDSGANTLRQAIAEADNGDFIDFNGVTDITLHSAIVLDKSITILGSGQKLVPNGEGYPAFHIPNPDVIGLPDGGAAPYITISRLWIDGFYNKGDNGRDWGGAISSSKTSTITVSSCIFSNNKCIGAGQAINKTWNPNGTYIKDRFYAYGCTFITNVNEDVIMLHEEPPVAIGNVFINTVNTDRRQLDAPNGDGTDVRYNVYSGQLIEGVRSHLCCKPGKHCGCKHRNFCLENNDAL